MSDDAAHAPKPPRPFSLHERVMQIRWQKMELRKLPRSPVVYLPAPQGLGLVWTEQGMRDSRNGAYLCSTAPMTDLARAAMADCDTRAVLREWGYSDGEGPDLGTMTLFGRGEVVDPVIMREVEAKAARDLARVTADAAKALAALAKAYDNGSWVMSPGALREAQGIMKAGIKTARAVERANDLVANVDAALARAEAALGEQVEGVDVDLRTRFEDPELRRLVHAGCKILSDMDADLASVRNNAGWSQATSRIGHLLARREVLDARHAAVGMSVMRGHRLQLPEEMRLALYGPEPAPARRRRAA